MSDKRERIGGPNCPFKVYAARRRPGENCDNRFETEAGALDFETGDRQQEQPTGFLEGEVLVALIQRAFQGNEWFPSPQAAAKLAAYKEAYQHLTGEQFKFPSSPALLE